MMRTMEDMQWGYVTGTNDVFDQYCVRFGKSLSTDETVTIVQTVQLAINPVNKRLYIYENGDQIGHTSAIVKEQWIENFCIGNEQIALVKCFETKSGSKYYFAPLPML